MCAQRTYSNRFDGEYRELILAKFRMTGEASLINTAVEIDDQELGGRKYDRIIIIDFYGIASSLLFDRNGEYNKLNAETSAAFCNFLSNAAEINEMGIMIRLRMLLVYPYSNYAFNRIQAELDENRSSINERKFLRFFNLAQELREDKFYGSTYYRNQIACLSRMQEFLKNGLLSLDGGPSQIKVRFTTIGTSVCMLRLNREYYYDPYIFAKENKCEHKLVVGFPLIQIDESLSNREFSCLDDHFRYIWTLDSTLDCEDATRYDRQTHEGLDEIKTGDQISFDNKAYRIQRLMKENGEPAVAEALVNEWKFKLRHKIKNNTHNIWPVPDRETVFITCSWKKKLDKSRPNEYATMLVNWLNEDFNPPEGRKCLNVLLVKASIGASAHEAIYSSLNESSLALILMTKDYIHEGVAYCKPNIYHELGYLMKHVGEECKLGVLIEEGVELPSNASDIVHITSVPTLVE